MVSKELVVEIYNSQNKEQTNIEEVEDYYENPPPELENFFIYPYRGHFVHETILEFHEFEYMIEEKANKPYYIPSKKELFTYLDDDYFKKNPHYNRLLDYIKKSFPHIAQEDIEEMGHEIHYSFVDEFNMEYIFSLFDKRDLVFESEKQMGDMLNLIMGLANSTQLWENNGFSPSEMSRIIQRDKSKALVDEPNIRKNKKTGRNDPCPCGSGKKYKKCCLAKENKTS
ncbi:MAG: hypothetical protein GX046_09660 [Tissierellia bacterium]|nr:hypothetical protein [Tissierellia bacterium]